MLNEVEEIIDSVLSQSIKPSLLPMDDLRETIPANSRASLLKTQSKLSLTNNEFQITYKILEYQPEFLISKEEDLPLRPQHNSTNYFKYKIDKPFVAMNSKHEIFCYESTTCSKINSINVCPPHLISLHKTPMSCWVGHPFFSKERGVLCVLFCSLQKNGMFFAFFSVLYKKMERFLCSFLFFTK